MTSMFIDEDDAKELFAGQVAIAMVLGNENDGNAHSASQYVEAIRKIHKIRAFIAD